jgi:hypothetical protein
MQSIVIGGRNQSVRPADARPTHLPIDVKREVYCVNRKATASIGGARDICEESDFADQFTGAELGDWFEIAGSAHSERTVQHHEQ